MLIAIDWAIVENESVHVLSDKLEREHEIGTLRQRVEPSETATRVEMPYGLLTPRTVESARTLTLLDRALFHAHASVETVIVVRTSVHEAVIHERIAEQRLAHALGLLDRHHAHQRGLIGVDQRHLVVHVVGCAVTARVFASLLRLGALVDAHGDELERRVERAQPLLKVGFVVSQEAVETFGLVDGRTMSRESLKNSKYVNLFTRKLQF